MRIVCRIFAALFLLAALAILALEVLAYSRTGEIAATLLGKSNSLLLLGQLVFELHSESLNLIQAVVERYLWPPLWDNVIFPILEVPAVLVFLAIALILLILCRRRRKRPSMRFKG